MQDVLTVSYLISKEFDLLSRSIFDHSDDCCEDCAGNATADGLTCVIPDLSCALPLRCPNNELDRGPMTRNALSALPPKADMCSALADVPFGPIEDIVQSLRRQPLREFGAHQMPGRSRHRTCAAYSE